MTKTKTKDQALRASVEAPNAAAEFLSLSPPQKDLLDQRHEESKEDSGKPWEQVKAGIWPALHDTRVQARKSR